MTDYSGNSRINDICLIEAKGPWNTKSEGVLIVPLALDLVSINSFLAYNDEELARIPEDIRGLRIYIIRKLQPDKEGAKEFHKLRKEIIFALDGEFRIDCEDMSGQKKSFNITQQCALLIPNNIMHTYVSLSKDGTLMVVANTLFNPHNPKTHDSYSLEEFELLKTK